ncbi:hypothetical protein LTR70_007132 [Exophiala xenobiotica]|uniref:N-acetyltransferase domain-containing protein n=1 Tax=Lithohypha guttulata TaxID=1690604 RepID=A0ABR0K6E7_9EURO|nr:hypothetical protein LTR24_006329 [Lithohypha guttulata]KAK5314503.1 hypothetical protein LTR70_007132 [Exophiala xenobiotica]
MSIAANAAAASDVVGTISTPNEEFKTTVKGRNGLPPVTTSSSEEYLEACARSNKKASRYDPLTLLFQAEKLPPLWNEPTFTDEQGLSRPTYSALRNRLARSSKVESLIYESSIRRIRYKARIGAFVAEAANWAATTTWEPVFAPPPPAHVENDVESVGSNTATPDGSNSEPWLAVMESLMSEGETVSDIYAQRPIFAEFLTRIEMARRKHLYPLLWKSKHTDGHDRKFDEHTEKAFAMDGNGQKHLLFWHLSVTSRNPAVQPPVPGAVRAVIEPFVKKWVDELGMPVVWLEAGSARARDVYSYFGFRVVEEIAVGEDEVGNTIKTWCMAYTRKL